MFYRTVQPSTYSLLIVIQFDLHLARGFPGRKNLRSQVHQPGGEMDCQQDP